MRRFLDGAVSLRSIENGFDEVLDGGEMFPVDSLGADVLSDHSLVLLHSPHFIELQLQ